MNRDEMRTLVREEEGGEEIFVALYTSVPAIFIPKQNLAIWPKRSIFRKCTHTKRRATGACKQETEMQRKKTEILIKPMRTLQERTKVLYYIPPFSHRTKGFEAESTSASTK